MKYSNINVEFKKPENEIKEQLSRSGARNIDIRRSYGGEIEVRYTIKCADPEKEIQTLLSNLPILFSFIQISNFIIQINVIFRNKKEKCMQNILYFSYFV